MIGVLVVLIGCIATACAAADIPEKQTERRKTAYACSIIMHVGISDGIEQSDLKFSLMDDDGNVKETVSPDENGNIVFNSLSFGIEDVGKTYSYSVRQEDTGRSTVIRDPVVRRAEISVDEEMIGVSVNVEYPDGTEFRPLMCLPGNAGGKEGSDDESSFDLSGVLLRDGAICGSAGSPGGRS